MPDSIRRVFVTGASGKLGVPLCAALRQAGYEIDLIDPVGQDFCIDTTRARYVLGFQPRYDIRRLIDRAVDFRSSGSPRRQRSGYQG